MELTSLKAGRDQGGFVVIVQGRGTMGESLVVKAFVNGVMDDASATLVIDLSNCTYLDSTFLGTLISMHRRFSKPAERFFLAAPSEKCKAVFRSNRLDTLLKIRPDKPRLTTEPIALPAVDVTARGIGEHVMESHERLVELGGENARAFAAIVQKLRGELKQRTA